MMIALVFTMEKKGIGTGIFTLIFGGIFALCLYLFIAIRNSTIAVDDVGELFVWLIFGPLGLLITGLSGIVFGSLCLLFLIITIVRISKYAKSQKNPKTTGYESEPTL